MTEAAIVVCALAIAGAVATAAVAKASTAATLTNFSLRVDMTQHFPSSAELTRKGCSPCGGHRNERGDADRNSEVTVITRSGAKLPRQRKARKIFPTDYSPYFDS
ncbi:hypothetical protein GCM10009765_24820 [Fodinicola feengrottensis]|uniref:Secreted protein n=1 Tax=Fodinicola feengrottensis TaxID=435914 RepID=A0ABP4SKS8_9ACTN